MAFASVLYEEKPDGAVAETGYEALVRPDDGGNNIAFRVEGVHCAGCIQKIESRLARENDVDAARLNYSTGRLTVHWKGVPARANDFARAVQELGYGVKPFDAGEMAEDSREEEKFLLFCLGLSGFAAGNMMTLSVVLWTTSSSILGMATEEFMHWVAAAIALPTVVIAGRPFFRSALKALSAGHTNMDVPISLGIVLACLISLSETIRHGQYVYFDSAVMLIFFLLIGRYLDCRTRRNARSAATDLLSSMTGFATVIEDSGSTRRLPIRDLRENMLVRAAVGEKIPADGRIEDGNTDIDASLVTGESLPQPAPAGTDVYAGTMNLSAPVTIRVAKAAENSLLADIVRLMEKAGQAQARYVRVAEKAAALYTPVVHIMALATFILWWGILNAPWQQAMMTAVTVLIITCPCALGLAVPVVQVLATGKLMKAGVLVKSGDALERLASIDSVIFDKTGTLTLGHPELRNMDEIPEEILALAAALATHSHHPLCRALAAAAPKKANPPLLGNVSEHAGAGMEGRWQEKTVRLGSRAWCGAASGAPAENPLMELWLAIEGAPPVVFFFEDMLRRDAGKTVAGLRAAGISVTLLSGDREAVVAKTAAQADIEDYAGGKTPIDKYRILEERKKQGKKILMVGDGLNDAPVLAGADVSISPSTAIDMAQNAADMIFMGDKLEPVATAWRTAVFSQKLVRENLWLAVLYNAIAIPVAVAGFVTPLMAAIAMSSSSVIVIANSFRLRRQK